MLDLLMKIIRKHEWQESGDVDAFVFFLMSNFPYSFFWIFATFCSFL
jgi:hypothetical protein